VAKEEERRDARPVETPTFVTGNTLTTAIDLGAPSLISRDVRSPSKASVNAQFGATSSRTLSTSTVSELTAIELGEDARQGAEVHGSPHFKKGDVEIICGDKIFRVHSTVVSSTSYKLRSILSPSVLLRARTRGGLPRITLPDNPEDFAVYYARSTPLGMCLLLRMFYELTG
jgi:hypothetical protein